MRWGGTDTAYLSRDQTRFVLDLSALASLLEAHPEIHLPQGIQPADAAVFIRGCLDAALGVAP